MEELSTNRGENFLKCYKALSFIINVNLSISHKRGHKGKEVFLSLWGKAGKKKWRIGPDLESQICWLYTKKRAENNGVPFTGWYQMVDKKWVELEQIKIKMRD